MPKKKKARIKAWKLPDPPKPLVLADAPPKLRDAAFLDIETSMAEDVPDLKKVGLVNYIAAPSNEMLVGCFKFSGEEEVRTFAEAPEVVFAGKKVYAHNASFEAHALSRFAPEKIKGVEWIDSAALARSLNLPGKLEHLVEMLFGSDAAKSKMPLPPPLPDESCEESLRVYKERYALYIERLTQYCRNDVAITELAVAEMRRVLERIHGDATAARWQQMLDEVRLTELINRNGVPVDLEFLAAARKRSRALRDEAEQTIRQLLPLDLQENLGANGLASTKVERILGWLRREKALPPDPPKEPNNLEQLAELAKKDSDHGAVARATILANQSFDAKFDAIERYRFGERLYDSFVFCSAHSGRESSRGAQMQNMKSPVEDDPPQMSVASLATATPEELRVGVRQFFAAPPGFELIILDMEGIEMRQMLHWLGRDDLIGLDHYKRVAGNLFDVDPATLTKTSEERVIGKRLCLAQNYGQGAMGFRESASEFYGRDVGAEFAKKGAAAYLAAFPGLGEKRNIAMSSWVKGEDLGLPPDVRVGQMDHSTGLMRYFVLPSGRELCYWNCSQQMKWVEWDGNADGGFYGEEFGYWTGSHYPYGKEEDGSFKHDHLFGGKLLAHLISGNCRDLLFFALQRFQQGLLRDKMATQLVATIHDEIIILAPTEETAQAAKMLQEAMTTAPPWMPNIQLGVEGRIASNWTSKGRKL